MPGDVPDVGDLGGVYSDPYTQQLLDLAQQQGGAVAETAGNLVHPNGSFLSMAKDKLGNAFHGLLDVLATPSETIAAGMSQFTQHPHSLSDAYTNHIAPSEVLFGKDAAASTAGKVGEFGIRFLADTLLDPLTYATMGEYSGLMGLSKLSSIPIKESTAAELGIKDLYQTSAGKEAIRHRTLSAEGQSRLQAISRKIEDTVRQDTLERGGWNVGSGKGAGFEVGGKITDPFLERFQSADNIRARVTKTLQPLIGKTVQEMLETFPSLEGASSIAGNALIKMVKDGALAAKPVEQMTAAERDAWTHAVNVSTKNAMDDQAARLVRHTIQARRSDIDAAAKETLSRILEKSSLRGHEVVDKFGKPIKDQFGNKMIRNMTQSIIDKGGFKMFGQSIVSGVRMRQIMNLVRPAEDSATRFSPKAAQFLHDLSTYRNYLNSLFSTNWTSEGRIPDTMLQIARQAKFKSESELSEFINHMERIGKKMAIPREEMQTAFAAAVMGKAPAEGGEGRLSALYALMHSKTGNQVMKDIANGVYGDGTKPEDVRRMWAAAKFVKDQLHQNLVMTRDAGMDIYEQKNYLPLLGNEPKQIASPYLRTKSTQAVNATKGQLNKWVNVDDPARVLFGTQEAAKDSEGNVHFLKQYNKAEERSRINDKIDKEVMRSNTRVADLKSEIEELWNKVNDRFKKSVLAPSESLMREAAGEDKFNYQALQKALEDTIPSVDRERLLADFGKKAGEEAGAVVSENKLKAEDITKLRSDLATGDQDLDNIVQQMLSKASEMVVSTGAAKKVTKAATTETEANYQKALKEMQKLVKQNGIDAKTKFIAEALGKDDSFKKVIANLADEWHQNPEGVQGFLKGISGRSQEIERTLSDLSETKHSLEQELNQKGLVKVADRWFYKDSAGEVYQRQRATAAEINKNYFDGKEMFSEEPFEPFFHSTENVLRTVNTKYLLKNIAEKFGVPESQAPSNYMKVSIASMSHKEGDLPDMLSKSGGAKEVESLMYHPSVAKNIVDIMRVMDKDPAEQTLLGMIDRLTNVFKVSVTAPFPAFHGRNAMSNVWQSMMDIGVKALSPAKHMMAIQLQKHSKQLENLMLDLNENPTPEKLAKYFELSDKVILKDKAGREWTVGELDRVIRDNVVAYHPSVLGMMDAGMTPGERMKELHDNLFSEVDKWGNAKRKLNPFKQTFIPYKVGRDFANYTESQPRILNFLANLENTGDVAFAAHQTKQFLYDHSNLTAFERNVLRRLIPFYAYTRKNTEGMIKAFIGKPGRVDWFRNAYVTLGDALAGGNLSNEERAQLPEWMRDSLDLVVKRNGSNVKLVTSMATPFEAPVDEIGNLFGSLNPIFKGPIEQITGFSFFEGKPLSQVTNAAAFKDAPEAVKHFIGFTERQYTDKQGNVHTLYIALNPRMMNIFNNLPLTSRTLSQLAVLQNPDIDTQNEVLANLLGIKPTTINLEDEEYQRQRELDEEIQQILSQAGVGYTKQDYTPPIGTKLPKPEPRPITDKTDI